MGNSFAHAVNVASPDRMGSKSAHPITATAGLAEPGPSPHGY